MNTAERDLAAKPLIRYQDFSKETWGYLEIMASQLRHDFETLTMENASERRGSSETIYIDRMGVLVTAVRMGIASKLIEGEQTLLYKSKKKKKREPNRRPYASGRTAIIPDNVDFPEHSHRIIRDIIGKFKWDLHLEAGKIADQRQSESNLIVVEVRDLQEAVSLLINAPEYQDACIQAVDNRIAWEKKMEPIWEAAAKKEAENWYNANYINGFYIGK